MSLKEKASQGCYHCSCCSHYHGIKKGCDLPECAFVPRKLLEDAEKEIDELKQKLRKFPCYKCVFFAKKDCQSQIACFYQMFLAWFKNEKIDELLKEEKEALTIAEKDDVKTSLKEIKEGRSSKKFKNVNDFLKELKEKEAK